MKNKLWIIILIGFLLRIWGINFGLPNRYIIDESEVLFSAFYSGAEFLKPFRFLYAPLVPHLLLIELGAYFVIGKFLGIFTHPEDVYVSYLRDPTLVFLFSRFVMVIAGVIAIWVMYSLGRKFFNERIGILSALFLSLNFLHVKESHYIKQDILSGLFSLISFYFLLHILKEKNKKNYIFTGIFVGLAIAAKYPAGLMLPVVFLAHFLRAKWTEKKKLFILVLSVAGSFALVNPHSIIYPFSFVQNSIKEYLLTAQVVNPYHLAGKPIWWHFLFEHLPQGLGIAMMAASVAGVFICVLRSRSEKQYMFVFLLPILFLTTIDIWSKFHEARYAVLIIPFFLLSSAILVDAVIGLARSLKAKVQAIILISICAVLLFQSLLRTIKFNYIITQKDTRTMGAKFIEDNIPKRSKIGIESTLKPEHPSSLNVPISLALEFMDKRILDAKNLGLPAQHLHALKKANAGKIGYDILATPRIDFSFDVITNKLERLEDVKYYVKEKTEYLITSSWVTKPDIKKEFEDSILKYYMLIKELRPNPEFSTDPHFVRMDYKALDSINILRKEYIFGPTIRVYRLKNSR